LRETFHPTVRLQAQKIALNRLKSPSIAHLNPTLPPPPIPLRQHRRDSPRWGASCCGSVSPLWRASCHCFQIRVEPSPENRRTACRQRGSSPESGMWGIPLKMERNDLPTACPPD
jgi:hypothetical protein